MGARAHVGPDPRSTPVVTFVGRGSDEAEGQSIQSMLSSYFIGRARRRQLGACQPPPDGASARPQFPFRSPSDPGYGPSSLLQAAEHGLRGSVSLPASRQGREGDLRPPARRCGAPSNCTACPGSPEPAAGREGAAALPATAGLCECLPAAQGALEAHCSPSHQPGLNHASGTDPACGTNAQHSAWAGPSGASCRPKPASQSPRTGSGEPWWRGALLSAVRRDSSRKGTDNPGSSHGPVTADSVQVEELGSWGDPDFGFHSVQNASARAGPLMSDQDVGCLDVLGPGQQSVPGKRRREGSEDIRKGEKRGCGEGSAASATPGSPGAYPSPACFRPHHGDLHRVDGSDALVAHPSPSSCHLHHEDHRRHLFPRSLLDRANKRAILTGKPSASGGYQLRAPTSKQESQGTHGVRHTLEPLVGDSSQGDPSGQRFVALEERMSVQPTRKLLLFGVEVKEHGLEAD